MSGATKWPVQYNALVFYGHMSRQGYFQPENNVFKDFRRLLINQKSRYTRINFMHPKTDPLPFERAHAGAIWISEPGEKWISMIDRNSEKTL